MINIKSLMFYFLRYFVLPMKGITHIKRIPQIIVSLTSFPDRIQVVDRVILSLLMQSLKPDLIILWLAEEQFPLKEKSLPRRLLRLQKFGLKILWCHDIRSYKKLIPTLLKYPEDIIVTADDDVYYDENWLELLYTSYLRHPKEIHCHHAFRYFCDSNFNIVKYEIDKNYGEILHNNSMAIGVGGILYPPHLLYKDVIREEVFCSIAPTNDDYWFWAMAMIQNTKIRLVENAISNIRCVENTMNTGLCMTENTKENSTSLFKRILAVYPQLKKYLTINII